MRHSLPLVCRHHTSLSDKTEYRPCKPLRLVHWRERPPQGQPGSQGEPESQLRKFTHLLENLTGSEAAQTTWRGPGPFTHHKSLLTTNFENSLFSQCSFLHSVCLICLPQIPSKHEVSCPALAIRELIIWD